MPSSVETTVEFETGIGLRALSLRVLHLLFHSVEPSVSSSIYTYIPIQNVSVKGEYHLGAWTMVESREGVNRRGCLRLFTNAKCLPALCVYCVESWCRRTANGEREYREGCSCVNRVHRLR